MAEEKVGFGFEFGIKGDKEVKKGLEDIIRLMGSAGNATSAVAAILSKAGGLVELGKMAAPIGLAATAMGIFAYKAAEAGENLRRTRFEIDRLSKMPVGALTDSDLMANQDALLEQFKNLGLEAGNTFQLSFMDRLKNFGRGAYAVNWDLQASIANFFGEHMQSYEQGSPEAVDAKNRLMEDQKIATDRIIMATRTQQSLAAIRRQAALDTAQLYSGNFLTHNGQAGTGVMPESFSGHMRQRDIRRNVDTQTDAALQRQIEFDKQQHDILKNAPMPNAPGTSKEDQLQDTAKRAEDVRSLEAKINDELAKQLDARQDILELEMQQRQMARNFVASQNYGSWRAVGGGGRAFIPPDFFRTFAGKKPDGLPTDVGYDMRHHGLTAAQIIANEKNGLAGGGQANAASSVSDLGTAAHNAAASLGDMAVKFVGELMGVDNALDKFEAGVGVVYNWVGNTNKKFFDKSTGIISHDMLTSPPTLKKREDEIDSSPFDFMGLMHDLFHSPPKSKDDQSSNKYRLNPATLSRNLTADYFPKDGRISDSDMSVYRDTGGLSSREAQRLAEHREKYTKSFSFPSEDHTSMPLRHWYGPTYRTSLSRGHWDSSTASRYSHDPSWYLAMKQGNNPAHYDSSFHPGSMNHDILGGMNGRVRSWQAPAWSHGVSGSMQSLDVLKSIDKNIGKVGIPTLAN